MEHEDDVQGAEFVARDPQVEPDDDGVEYNAEFQDQEGGDLLPKCGPAAYCVAESEFLVEGFVLRADDGPVARHIVVLPVFHGGDGALDVFFRAVAVFGLDVALRSKVEKKDQHDGSEHDGGTPRILRPIPRHAHARLGPDLAVCWVQEVYESGGDDDAGAKIAGEEVDVDGDAETGDSLGDDGEEGCTGGYDHDDEEGGDAGAESAVILIVPGIEGADDIAWVGG